MSDEGGVVEQVNHRPPGRRVKDSAQIPPTLATDGRPCIALSPRARLGVVHQWASVAVVHQNAYHLHLVH